MSAYIYSIMYTICTYFRNNREPIKQISSPYFPLDVLREFAMNALCAAVKTNQVANRDPIGGSNEKLFV